MSATNMNELRFAADDQLKQCRICLDSDNPNDIISPCLCSGTLAYVHRKCLNNWRSENADGKAFQCCNICQFKYIIETIGNDPKADRERLLKYHFFVIRDLTSIILLIQLIIIGLAFLLKTIDKNNNNIKNLFPDVINEFVVYYLSAFILLLALLGIIVLIILCYIGTPATPNRRSTRNNPHQRSKDSVVAIFATFVTMVLISALIGMFVGIILSIIVLKKVMKHYTEKVWLRQEAEKYIVRDFQGRRNELENYRRNLSTFSLIS